MVTQKRFEMNEAMLAALRGAQISETAVTPDNAYVELGLINGQRILIQAVRVKMPDGSTGAELAIVDSTAKAKLL